MRALCEPLHVTSLAAAVLPPWLPRERLAASVQMFRWPAGHRLQLRLATSATHRAGFARRSRSPRLAPQTRSISTRRKMGSRCSTSRLRERRLRGANIFSPTSTSRRPSWTRYATPTSSQLTPTTRTASFGHVRSCSSNQSPQRGRIERLTAFFCVCADVFVRRSLEISDDDADRLKKGFQRAFTAGAVLHILGYVSFVTCLIIAIGCVLTTWMQDRKKNPADASLELKSTPV